MVKYNLIIFLVHIIDHVCLDPLQIANGQIVFSNDTTSPFDFGTLATYTCDTGFSLVGESDGTRTCSGDGSSPVGMWTGDIPTCIGEYSIYFSSSA